MKVTVRFFASYREHIGKRSMSITLDDKATVADLVTYINKTFPGFSSHPDRIVVALNEEYVSHNQRLKDGDEAAFIPPVSGGAITNSLINFNFPLSVNTERGPRGEVVFNDVSHNQRLKDGDEAAFIPPVSGGALDDSTSPLSFVFPLSVDTERGLRGEVVSNEAAFIPPVSGGTRDISTSLNFDFPLSVNTERGLRGEV